MLNLAELFEKHEDEYLKFDRIEQPMHPCADIAALLLLDTISPLERPGQDAISCAEHDEIVLRYSPEDIASKATEAQIIDLIRCGVIFSESDDCFQMFV